MQSYSWNFFNEKFFWKASVLLLQTLYLFPRCMLFHGQTWLVFIWCISCISCVLNIKLKNKVSWQKPISEYSLFHQIQTISLQIKKQSIFKHTINISKRVQQLFSRCLGNVPIECNYALYLLVNEWQKNAILHVFSNFQQLSNYIF